MQNCCSKYFFFLGSLFSVILRSPYVGNQWMSRSQYKQMIGRAGRAGIDTSGESILIIGNKDKTRLNLLIRGAMGTCRSNLMYEKGKGLRELILSLLGLNVNKFYFYFFFKFLLILSLNLLKTNNCIRTIPKKRFFFM